MVIALIARHGALRADLKKGSVAIVEQPIKSDPKPRKIKLSPLKYTELRMALYKVYDRNCPECGKWRELEQLHIHHKKTRGGRGDDRLSNLSWECFKCHREGP